jgi:hypothetical protein
MTRAAVLLSVLLAASASATPRRLLLSIGNDVGAANDVRLHHAQTDAQRVRDLFLEVGDVAPQDAVLLLEPSSETVQAALASLAARATRETTLLVYVSSHAQAGTLHLGASDLPLRTLREAVEAVPAAMRLLVVDACTSGAAARAKGGAWAPPSKALQLQPSRGTVVITSSGPAEPSQEWDSLGGSLFTHHWLGALRGQADVDGDGRVTLLEAYAHAWRQTVARADQHPTYDFDLQGTSDVVLTEPRKSPSALSFSAALGGRFVVVGEPDARLVLELEKVTGATLRLAVPPGGYRVRQLGGPGARVAFVDLPWGRVRALGESDFATTLEPQVALKGGWRNATLGVELSALGAGVPDWDLSVGGGLLGRLDFAGWWVSLGVGFASAAVKLPGARRDDLFGSVSVGLGFSAVAGALRFGLGAVGRPMWLSSTVTPLEGAPTQRTRPGVELGPAVSVEWNVAGSLFMGAEFEGLLRVIELEARTSPSLGVRGALLAGFRL